MADQCDPNFYGDIFRGMALASQQNQTDLESDCFLNTDSALVNFEGLAYSVYDVYIYLTAASEDELPARILKNGHNPLFSPISWFQTLSVVLSDTMVACDVKSFFKQVNFRLSSLSGFEDSLFIVLSAVFFGYFGQFNPAFESELYNAAQPIIE